MAVPHTHSEAQQALDSSGQSASARAQAQQDSWTPEAQAAELHRQARRQNYQDYGVDPGPDWDPDSGPVTAEDLAEPVDPDEGGFGVDPQPLADSLQERLNAAMNDAVAEIETPQRGIVRGGITVVRWGLMINDDSEDYTLGLSVAYNDQEPADVYIDITEQRVNEWRSLQGKDGEARFAMGLVSHLVNLTGQDIAVAIASALGELVSGGGDEGTHQDLPTETAIGPDDDDDVPVEAS